MGAWIVLALWMSPNLTAVPRSFFAHVRSEDPRVRALLVEGYAHSGTFRKMVDAAEALSCIVYISSAVKLSQGMNGALLHQSGGRPEMPVLRVLLKTNLSSDEAMATIAHELQHVVEGVTGLTSRGDGNLRAVFESLGAAGARGTTKYDTEAAIQVTLLVRSELHHRRNRENRQGPGNR
jgi:hypothetical protein